MSNNILNSQYDLDSVLLNMYIELHNTTMREISRLDETLNDVRNSIRILELNNLDINYNIHTLRNRINNIRNAHRNRRHADERLPRVPLQQTNFPIAHQQTQFQSQTNGTNNIFYNGRYYTIDYIMPETLFQFPARTNESLRSNSLNNLFSDAFLNDTFQSYVEPRPTNQELQEAILNTTFGTIENPINTTCPITLDRFENDTNVSQIIPCGHIFDATCLNNWFQNNSRCPVCRYDIRRHSRRSRTSIPTRNGTSHNPIARPEANENSQNNSNHSNSNMDSLSRNETDSSGNVFLNLATQALTELLRNSGGNRSFLDPSGNEVLLFETILRM
jgi:hypothetical protein